MSSEPDYNFNPPQATTTSEGNSLSLPFALLTAAIAVMFVAQTMTAFKAKTALHDGKKQLSEAFEARKPAVKQSGEIKEKLSQMVQDLLILAQTDKQAEEIVKKNGIQFNGNPGAAAPAATPEAPK